MTQAINTSKCKLLLRQNYIGHLSYMYNNRPFVVPISYFYKDDQIICYSGEGHKITAMRLHEFVALEVSEITSVKEWKSVAVHGRFQELDGPDAKAKLHEFSLGIKEVILKSEHKDLDFISEFSAKIDGDEIPTVFTIEIDALTGKMNASSK